MVLAYPDRRVHEQRVRTRVQFLKEANMYASFEKHEIPISAVFRFCGRTGALLIAVSWLAFVVIEYLRTGPPVVESYYQGAMLAIVFAGYAVGWRQEALGGALAIIGTLGFVLLNTLLLEFEPNAASAGFAVPGLFYLGAHYLNRRQVAEREWRQ
jgi:hypothetical protein